jgi:hypothetical protein
MQGSEPAFLAVVAETYYAVVGEELQGFIFY